MSTPLEKALFGEALEIADPVPRRQFLDQAWSRRSLAWRNDMPVRTATARVILAMSLREDGEPEAALSELEQARNIIESGFDAGLKHGIWDGGLWFDWVFARVLFREASELFPPNAAPREALPHALSSRGRRRRRQLSAPGQVKREPLVALGEVLAAGPRTAQQQPYENSDA